MRPGLITATQCSGLPLPLPIRVSAGFTVSGLSGKMLIHSLPPRLTVRVMATREASIWRLVIQPHSSALRPYEPNTSSLPRYALPRRLPFCILRCLVLLGSSIVVVPWSLGAPRRGGSRALGHAPILIWGFSHTSPRKIHALMPMMPYFVLASARP